MLTIIFDGQVPPATPTYTEYFSNAVFLAFQSDTTGEYVETGEFIEVAVALFSRLQFVPLLERLCLEFPDTINTIDLIPIPKLYRNDLFPMRLLINPSISFHARIYAVSENW